MWKGSCPDRKQRHRLNPHGSIEALFWCFIRYQFVIVLFLLSSTKHHKMMPVNSTCNREWGYSSFHGGRWSLGSVFMLTRYQRWISTVSIIFEGKSWISLYASAIDLIIAASALLGSLSCPELCVNHSCGRYHFAANIGLLELPAVNSSQWQCYPSYMQIKYRMAEDCQCLLVCFQIYRETALTILSHTQVCIVWSASMNSIEIKRMPKYTVIWASLDLFLNGRANFPRAP